MVPEASEASASGTPLPLAVRLAHVLPFRR